MILLDLIALDIDPNVVKPGWIPLFITVAMAGVLVLLYLSMRRQFRRIDVSQNQPGDPEQTPVAGSEPAAGPDAAPGEPAPAPAQPVDGQR